MKTLVIAPTATFRKGVSIKSTEQLNDAIKDSPEAVVIEQRVDSIMPPNCDKSGVFVVEQRIYQDMRPINHIHKRNRERDLQIYDMDRLYSVRPLYNVSYPDMKLRKQP